MVCVPCFIIPALLFLWHRFIQPYVLRFWNPWAVKDEQGNVVKTEFPFACEGGVCAFSKKPIQKKELSTENETNTSTESEPNPHETIAKPERLKAE
ncbi:Follicle cell protein 3C [Operophtera brumata]|uniref:Follicle cell protein 3C n=1 Tax=Operophtera brumata TaxID=104452 RepID=A0A0L7KTI8_OPEBR|nr:Follicle cell protein 3C [Operophtera brumata]